MALPKKEEEWKKYLPKTAVSGNFFRTLAFYQELAPDIQTWFEASENPLTNTWKVTEIWQRPNTTSSTKAERITERKTLRGSENLSLTQALEKLFEYETAQTSMMFKPVGKTAREFGDGHVVQFAKNESCIFDIHGQLHPVFNGHLISDGIFPDDAFETAKKTRIKRAPAETRNLDLSHLFRTSAQADDLSRLIDTKLEANKWDDFTRLLIQIASNLNSTQKDKFEITKTEKFMVKIVEVKGYSDFIDRIKEARAGISLFPFLNEGQIQACKTYLEQAELTYHIACAKCFFMSLENRGKEAVEKQVAAAANFCRNIGGSEADVKRINAEIINPKKQQALNKREIFKVLKDNHENEYNYDTELYYFPDALLENLQSVLDIGNPLKRAVEDERNRITRAPAGPS